MTVWGGSPDGKVGRVIGMGGGGKVGGGGDRNGCDARTVGSDWSNIRQRNWFWVVL